MKKKEKKKTRKIYIILSYTGTLPSKLIRLFTGGEYSHVSISLDKKLKNMYSFARLHPYNFLVSGFVHEDINSGTFKRFKNTKVEVYSLELPVSQYRKIWWRIHKMKREKTLYKYNFIGVFGVKLKIRYTRRNYFYCAEFVKFLFDEAKVDLELPELIEPMDFRGKKSLNLEYRGLLRDYP